MKIRTFIDRPILAGVISVVFLIIGLIGLSQLPVEQFPEIAPPTVSVSANYTGANAETVQKLAAPFPLLYFLRKEIQPTDMPGRYLCTGYHEADDTDISQLIVHSNGYTLP